MEDIEKKETSASSEKSLEVDPVESAKKGADQLDQTCDNLTDNLSIKVSENAAEASSSKESADRNSGDETVGTNEQHENTKTEDKPAENPAEIEQTSEVPKDEKVSEQKETLEETEEKSGEKTEDEKSKSSEQEQNEESEDEGIDDISSTEELDQSGRDAMYDRGVQYEKKKKNNLALKCFLQCLKGLDNADHFSFLPQCLRKIADIYFEKEELEKAIQFIQAEKMFYETALIDTSELEKKLEERKNEQSGEEKIDVDAKTTTPEVVRADEYEKLAKMCLKQNQVQLALEYQGKATKLRQQVYGNDHEVTTKSLDFFTVIYGEVGKQQYSESMQKLNNPPEESEEMPDTPQSILRRRKKAEHTETEKDDEVKEEKKKVRFAESQISREQEEWISQKLLYLLLFFSMMVCVVLVFYIYCKTHPRSESCSYWKTEIFYYYMRIKYMYHYYFAAGKNQVVG